MTSWAENRRLEGVSLSLGKGLNGESNLSELVKNLRGDDYWVDGGAGAGLVQEDAIIQFRKSEKRQLTDVPHTVGITYAPPDALGGFLSLRN